MYARSNGHVRLPAMRRRPSQRRGTGLPPEPVHEGGPFEQVDTELGPLWMQTSDEVMRPYMMQRRDWEDPRRPFSGAAAARVPVPGRRGQRRLLHLFAHRLARRPDRRRRAPSGHPQPAAGQPVGERGAGPGPPAALGLARRLLPMSSPPDEPRRLTGGGAHTRRPLRPRRAGVRPTTVRRRTFDVAKIDVQGFEPEVILGMERIVRDVAGDRAW